MKTKLQAPTFAATVKTQRKQTVKEYLDEWEMPVMLDGLYGMRRSEILGLRWQNVDLKNSWLCWACL